MADFFVTKKSTAPPSCEEDVGYVPVELGMDIDEESAALNWLRFKDQFTGTIYKLRIYNGLVDLQEDV